MGLWKIDAVSREEWERRMLRRYRIRQWAVLAVEIALIVGACFLFEWLIREIQPLNRT